MAALASRALGAVIAGGLLLALAMSQASLHPLSLRSGPATFTIQARIAESAPGAEPSRGCSGETAPLVPGVTRCLAFRIDNRLGRAIRVRSITTGRSTRSSPPPPAACSSDTLSLPQYAGSLLVRSGRSALTPGLPIRLRSTRTNQDGCKLTVLHFRYTGTASYVRHAGGLPDAGAALGPRDLVGLVMGACLLVGTGVFLVVAARRRRGARS